MQIVAFHTVFMDKKPSSGGPTLVEISYTLPEITAWLEIRNLVFIILNTSM